MSLLTEKVIVIIKGDKYRISSDVPTKGDYVLDKRDFCYGKIDMIHNNGTHCAVGDMGIVEVGIPLSELWKLELVEKVLQPFKL